MLEFWDVAKKKKVKEFSQLGILDEEAVTGIRVSQLSDRILKYLTSTELCHPVPIPSALAAPQYILVGQHLSGLGQLLHQTMVESGVVPLTKIVGEADMLQWYRMLVSRQPYSVLAQLMWIRGVLLSYSYGSKAYETHLPDLLAQLALLTDPDGSIARLSPVIYKKLGHVQECQDRRQQLGVVPDSIFLDWLKKIDCDSSNVPGTPY